jgi:hypothetical protein
MPSEDIPNRERGSQVGESALQGLHDTGLVFAPRPALVLANRPK